MTRRQASLAAKQELPESSSFPQAEEPSSDTDNESSLKDEALEKELATSVPGKKVTSRSCCLKSHTLVKQDYLSTFSQT